MIIDYQVVMNLFINCFTFAFPIGLIMLICEKILDIFQNFVLGRKEIIK